MPFGDGTGPLGRDTLAGRGFGKGRGRGRKGGNRPGAGPGGDCICPSCGEKLPHHAGTPCGSLYCTKCGNRMVRE